MVVLVAQLEVAEDDRDLCARNHENEQHEREEAKIAYAQASDEYRRRAAEGR